MSVRLTYYEQGTRVTHFGIWPSTWDAVDWALGKGLHRASAKAVNRTTP